ncbi:hypothetical protein BC936DRAFT_140752 [Jimgerdemannia flammicorona]|uniref:Uncharacterized protein n=1 Tax=Jimgerdemannia flammicorona TaxID=994334 RepID=A0A433A9B5_9FUNG|nr:hypothetical protein BC936DRAFT_140752 [Jimgerdemannia flammicorona]
MNPVARPPRREWATYREIARPTTRIVLAVGADDTTNTQNTANLTYNTFTCSICLLPTYIPVDQLAASLASTNSTCPSPACDDLDWLSRVVVLRHCPAYGHDLERVQDGRFTGPTKFEPARGGSVTPPAQPPAPGQPVPVVVRGIDPNKITAYKVTVHRECYDRVTAELSKLAGGPALLVRRLEALRRGEEDEEDETEAARMTREFGMLLRERAERVEMSGVHVLQVQQCVTAGA